MTTQINMETLKQVQRAVKLQSSATNIYKQFILLATVFFNR